MTTQKNTLTCVENQDARVELTNGIIYVYIKSGTHVTVETQEGFVEMFNQITIERRPFIYAAGEFVTFSKEAIDNAPSLEERTPLTASAFVVSNLAQKILADFYYRFKKTKNPIKICRSRECAEKWLEKYK